LGAVDLAGQREGVEGVAFDEEFGLLGRGEDR
jgi:hypothetical protein